MNGVRVTFKYDFAEGMIRMIDELASKPIEQFDDDDKLIIAALMEIRTRLYTRLAHSRLQYTMTLTPVQALAMRIFYTDFVHQDPTGYMANRLRQISDQVYQTYSTYST